LGDETEADAVFASFLGDAQQRAAGRRKTDAPVDRRVAVRLLADEKHRHRPVAPQAEVEGEAAEQTDDGVDDLHRQSGELQYGQRLTVRLEAEQIGEDLAHRVAADVGVLEHEGVARVVAQPVDAESR